MENAKQPLLYKTEMCNSYTQFGNCCYGVKCQFAHGVAELRQLHRHPKYKTIKCKSYSKLGSCRYGTRCRFLHAESGKSENSLQTPPLPMRECKSHLSANGTISFSNMWPASDGQVQYRLDYQLWRSGAEFDGEAVDESDIRAEYQSWRKQVASASVYIGSNRRLWNTQHFCFCFLMEPLYHAYDTLCASELYNEQHKKLLKLITTNLIKHPTNIKYHSLLLSAPKIKAALQVPGFPELLQSIGFDHMEGEYLIISRAMDNYMDLVQEASALLVTSGKSEDRCTVSSASSTRTTDTTHSSEAENMFRDTDQKTEPHSMLDDHFAVFFAMKTEGGLKEAPVISESTRADVLVGSRLVAINHVNYFDASYVHTMTTLQKASYPLTLRFVRPKKNDTDSSYKWDEYSVTLPVKLPRMGITFTHFDNIQNAMRATNTEMEWATQSLDRTSRSTSKLRPLRRTSFQQNNLPALRPIPQQPLEGLHMPHPSEPSVLSRANTVPINHTIAPTRVLQSTEHPIQPSPGAHTRPNRSSVSSNKSSSIQASYKKAEQICEDLFRASSELSSSTITNFEELEAEMEGMTLEFPELPDISTFTTPPARQRKIATQLSSSPPQSEVKGSEVSKLLTNIYQRGGMTEKEREYLTAAAIRLDVLQCCLDASNEKLRKLAVDC